MKELRVRLQYLISDGMAEAVDDVLRLVRREGIERGFDIVDIAVDRMLIFDEWTSTGERVDSVDGKFFRMPTDTVRQCFGCHVEIGKGHLPACPVAGARIS